ncbi:malonic semialdehyde reductase [Aurantiacibacter spongiae]|uniref:Putative NADH dehydrogenase/NAD(P)H nitroreductase EG799_03470 n=1 Tax=Aurantiacibacter spongiae TaxID=2488860 RepID=A0A3N5CP84_9SPHN|nr:malonic semialdehyde reductase [Aurantiacibacter spongiae]RPF70784.1 malonic semialdehyde reductase [Aurantiacibacter spongiae]
MTTDTLSADALDLIFRDARSFNGWHDKEVTDDQIKAIYELAKMGPTSANQQPARFVWCKSQDAKERLAKHASEGNRDKILTAPVCVIIGYDLDFHEHLPWLFPHADARSWFEGDRDARRESAFRNSALQGAYLMIAARALGLDCGPMSGFDQDGTTREFFADQPNYRADWLCSIGYGDRSTIFDRSPRPEFDRFNRLT